jgi:hypothetical protein
MNMERGGIVEGAVIPAASDTFLLYLFQVYDLFSNLLEVEEDGEIFQLLADDKAESCCVGRGEVGRGRKGRGGEREGHARRGTVRTPGPLSFSSLN